MNHLKNNASILKTTLVKNLFSAANETGAHLAKIRSKQKLVVLANRQGFDVSDVTITKAQKAFVEQGLEVAP